VLDSQTLMTLRDDAALLSLEHQLHLDEVLGERHWAQADLNAPRLEFVCARRTVTCHAVHLLGSAAPGPQSWLWGWASPTAFPPSLTTVAESVREFGLRHAIAELTSAELPFASLPGPATPSHRGLSLLSEAAKAISGHWTSYNYDAGGGTRVAFLIDHPEFRLPVPYAPRVLRVILQGVSELTLADPRRAVHSYVTRRGLTSMFGRDRSRLVVSVTDMEMRIDFDDLGRVVEMHVDQS